MDHAVLRRCHRGASIGKALGLGGPEFDDRHAITGKYKGAVKGNIWGPFRGKICGK